MHKPEERCYAMLLSAKAGKARLRARTRHRGPTGRHHMLFGASTAESKKTCTPVPLRGRTALSSSVRTSAKWISAIACRGEQGETESAKGNRCISKPDRYERCLRVGQRAGTLRGEEYKNWIGRILCGVLTRASELQRGRSVPDACSRRDIEPELQGNGEYADHRLYRGQKGCVHLDQRIGLLDIVDIDARDNRDGAVVNANE